MTVLEYDAITLAMTVSEYDAITLMFHQERY